ncbi:HMG box-containing protein 1-like [Neocloeon triangulifer]|uniref:HMG box-containing protein 1-like n=1 Tax=Neocloeon triangulifer TaxID=2078957 RepID=UPI00286FA472|nr:HMG box-containing protein 1-like [Neocloeon triangulifer]
MEELHEGGGSLVSEEQEAPKDLSVKARKLKPVPPPLDLRLGTGTPTDTSYRLQLPPPSPLSPNGQKSLPFRKRAHSLSGQEAAVSPAPYAPTSAGIKEETHSRGRGPFSVERLLAPPSALLSPSSLGSSQEELCSPLWPPPLPPGPRPVWHCFGPGSKVRLGASWQAVEELGASWSPDWPLQVETLHLLGQRLLLQMHHPAEIRRPWEGCIAAECELEHPFLVQDKGWCAAYPDLALQKYGLVCQPLDKGDILLAPTKLPMNSPDICDRFKRFSFTTEEQQMVLSSAANQGGVMNASPDGLLSPPVSPVKKVLDPNRPKRPMNAFMLFAKKHRLELIQKHPGKDNRAISVLLGESWRSLPQNEREVFVQEARLLATEQKRLHPDCWKRKRSHSTPS